MTTQVQVINKLEPQALKAVDQIRHAGAAHLADLWATTKAMLRDCVARHYRADFPKAEWSALAIGKGTLRKIDAETGGILQGFHQESMRHATRTFREVYKESVLRRAWILDQVTPPTILIRLPHPKPMMESERGVVRTFAGPDASTSWKVRWASWMDAYQTALMRNLQLGAINDGPLEDAVDEVDATRPGTPAAEVGSALARVFDTETAFIAASAANEVVDANPHLGIKEIWQTRYNTRVCEICEEQVGLTKSEATIPLPAHPRCECYWRQVPASWADLLKSGEAMDQELAKDLDAAGLVPGGMYVYGNGGKIAATAVITFPEWLSSRVTAVTGR